MGVGWAHSLMHSITIGHEGWVLLDNEGRLIHFAEPDLLALPPNVRRTERNLGE